MAGDAVRAWFRLRHQTGGIDELHMPQKGWGGHGGDNGNQTCKQRKTSTSQQKVGKRPKKLKGREETRDWNRSGPIEFAYGFCRAGPSDLRKSTYPQ